MRAESSRTTHGVRTAVDACRWFAGLIVGVLRGENKERLLSPGYCPVAGYWQHYPLCREIAEIAVGSFARKEPPAIRGSGYVVECLEAALWAFHKGSSFEEGALLAVNLGNDADTTGAVYGQLVGAHYGLTGIPESWRAKIAPVQLITELADGLYRAARLGKGTGSGR